MNYLIDIRQRRQTTIPSAVLAQLGVGVGDSLEIVVNGKEATIKPRKQAALDALKEIQEAFKESRLDQRILKKAVEENRLV